jgi:hypothetical protein
MTNRWLLGVGALALSATAIASAKTYDVVVSNSVKAGSAQLAPGEYKLKVDGSNAIFTDTQSRKSITVPVKVESGKNKYSATALDTSKQGGTEQITSIELGGSNTKLEFGK